MLARLCVPVAPVSEPVRAGQDSEVGKRACVPRGPGISQDCLEASKQVRSQVRHDRLWRGVPGLGDINFKSSSLGVPAALLMWFLLLWLFVCQTSEMAHVVGCS